PAVRPGTWWSSCAYPSLVPRPCCSPCSRRCWPARPFVEPLRGRYPARMSRRLLPSSCFLAFVAAAACTASRASSPPAPPVEDPRQVVAQVAGSNITLEDVDHRAGGKLQRLRDEEYQARHQALEEIIAERLVEKEAASRGLTTEALLKAEVEAKVPLPKPAEVKGI